MVLGVVFGWERDAIWRGCFGHSYGEKRFMVIVA